MNPATRPALARFALPLLVALTAAQGVPFLLQRWQRGEPLLPVLLGALLATLAAAFAWRARILFSAHADMLLIMAAFGGFGMWLGGRMDHLLDPAAPLCPLHDHRGAAALLSTWMAGIMLIFAIPPSVLWSRCLQPLRRRPAVLFAALALDTAGMLAGMIAAHGWLGQALATRIPPPELGMHLAMLAGMLGGMIPAMSLRDLILKRWQPPGYPAPTPS